MLSKTQILNKIRYIKKKNSQYCIAIKAVVGKDEIEKRDGTELRLVPVVIDTDEQFDYTMRFCRVMIAKDGRELVPFSTDKLEYVDIIGADCEEECNKKIKNAISKYSRQNGFGKVMSQEQLVKLANESLADYQSNAG